MSVFSGLVLLIDNSHDVNNLLKDHKLIEQYPLMVVKSLAQAESMIRNKKLRVRVVLVCSLFCIEENIETLVKILTANPEIHFVLMDKQISGEFKENAALDEVKKYYTSVIDAPRSYADVVSYLISHFEDKNDWNEVEEGIGEKFKEIELVDSDFIAIPVGEYLVTAKSFFNIYIKVGKSKFVKILNAGDELDQKFTETWINKGVIRYFILAEEHTKYLSMLGNLNQKVLNNQSVPLKSKIQTTLKYGFQVNKNIFHFGLKQTQVDEALNFLEQTFMVLRDMRIKDDFILRYIEIVKNSDHISSVAFIAGLIALEMDISSKKTSNMLGISALIHDIGFMELYPQFLESKESELEKSEPKIFAQHAMHGANILRNSQSFDEAICLAVEQHHYKRRSDDKSERTLNLSIMSEIVSLADCFFNYVIKNERPDSNSTSRMLSLKFFQETEMLHYSQKVSSAFQKVFDLSKVKEQ